MCRLANTDFVTVELHEHGVDKFFVRPCLKRNERISIQENSLGAGKWFSLVISVFAS